MKQSYWIFLLACMLLISCQEQRKKFHLFEDETTPDTLVSQADSLLEIQKIKEAELQKPTEADELFDDFIFNFIQNKDLQLSRTNFPLTCFEGNSSTKIEKADWKHDDIFLKYNFYSIFFDREEDMDIVGDTTLTSVQVEKIQPYTRTIKKYFFERKNNTWRLEAIDTHHIEEVQNDFLDFYLRFATDTTFQCQHLAKPLYFTTIDPDDEFSLLETTIDENQWMAFRPNMPAEMLSNINYGQKNEINSNIKILKVSGIDSAVTHVFYFRRKGQQWELYKYEDGSI